MSPTPGVSPLPCLGVPWCARFCQFLLTALDDIILHLSPLQYISCQTHCQAHFTSVSCWCETHWDPPAGCLTLPPPFPPPPPPPPPHPRCRSQHFHTFLTAAPCSGSNLPKSSAWGNYDHVVKGGANLGITIQGYLQLIWTCGMIFLSLFSLF